MPIGPGKYDKECTAVRESIAARAVLLIVIDGDRGSGFACQADLDSTLSLPEILERTAAEIRQSLRKGQI